MKKHDVRYIELKMEHTKINFIHFRWDLLEKEFRLDNWRNIPNKEVQKICAGAYLSMTLFELLQYIFREGLTEAISKEYLTKFDIEKDCNLEVIKKLCPRLLGYRGEFYIRALGVDLRYGVREFLGFSDEVAHFCFWPIFLGWRYNLFKTEDKNIATEEEVCTEKRNLN